MNQNKEGLAGLFTAFGIVLWVHPAFGKILSQAGSISDGNVRIMGSVFLVGAAILYFMPMHK